MTHCTKHVKDDLLLVSSSRPCTSDSECEVHEIVFVNIALSPIHTCNIVEAKTATMSNEFTVTFRDFDKVETS